MSYTLRIFCGTSANTTPREIIDFINDGVFFDSPVFTPSAGSAESEWSNWRSLVIKYSPDKQPIVVERDDGVDRVKKAVSDLMFILDVSKKTSARQRVVNHLQATTQLFSLTVHRDELSDECWRMLDSLEAYLAKKCDGIIYTPDEGFFDRDLKHFYTL